MTAPPEHRLDGPLSRSEERLWRLRLAMGPWCWPAPQAAGHEFAQQLCPEGPRDILPGEVLLLTATDAYGDLWLARVPHVPHGPAVEGVRTAVFGPDVRDVWARAARGVSNALPFAVQSIQHRSEAQTQLWSFAAPVGQGVTLADTLLGQSFGLALALGLASCALDEPVPAEVVAMAALNEEGRTLPVDGLPAKCGALRALTRGTQRVLVAPEQALVVRELMPSATVVEIADVGAAIVHTWPRYPEALAAKVREGDDRARLVDQLLLLALRGRQSLQRWEPVARTAELLLELELDAVERTKVQLVAAIARRNDGRSYPLAFTLEDLTAFPQPTRTAVAAHLVQHAAGGDLPVPEARRIYEACISHGPDAFPEHLRLLGAWGRLMRKEDQLDVALRAQREAVRGWLLRRAYDELSYPLSEWLALASALERVDEFDDACRCFDENDGLGLFSSDGLPYLLLAAAEGERRFGRTARAQAFARRGRKLNGLLPGLERAFEALLG